MTPMSFDPGTSRQMISDARAREIEQKARADADLGESSYSPPTDRDVGPTYWDKCRIEFERSVYHAQFTKRFQRNARKKEAAK